jgi:superfamily I DNA and/or RNA helicase/very-short-patch-repair endonuclease
MKITNKLLNELQNRLKVGSKRGVHLNAIPARSKYKFDLTRLSHIDKHLPQNFINSLLSEKNLKFKISWKDNVPDLNTLFEDDKIQLVKITKSFENLINQTDAIESEKGINTFGFGFPLLIRRDQSDNKLTVAPILIWSLKIIRTKEFNTWVIIRDEDNPIYINEVLINHLQSDSKIIIDPISSELLDDGFIDKNELLDICINIIEKINSTSSSNLSDIYKQKLDNVKSIKDKKYYEKIPLTSNNSFIDFSGLFSIFEVQKQNIIQDYENLIKLEGSKIDLDDMEEHFFQSISSVETDPSQQSILNSLNNVRNILIQGPPGTGKSQTLLAILINALENHKKIIVVCEKITALNVLKKALDEKGLNDLNVQITEVQKSGRRNVVNSVRDRIENTQYRRYKYTYSKDDLNNIINKAKLLIDSINKKHLKLDENILGNKNWTYIVGWLLSELKENKDENDLDFERDFFQYELPELNNFLEIIRKGQKYFNEYNLNKEYSYLNSSKLVGDNPFELEQKINQAFKYYKDELEGEKSDIKLILDVNKNNIDFLNLNKTNTISYKIASFFSKLKKKTLKNQKLLFENCLNLTKYIENDNWAKQSIDKSNFKTIISSIKSILNSHKVYNTQQSDLFSIEFKWFQFYNILNYKEQQLLKKLLKKVNWKKVFLVHYLNSALLYSANISLPTDDNDLEELNNSMSDLESQQLKYIREYWFSKQIDATRSFDINNPNLTVENLYNKRKSNNHKRLSLRQIVKFDIDLFSTFFPIILTTPDVCSNLFNGKNKYFNIVMFDEASQLKLEDNLPALLKGKQIIIAGDEHQMPPSNYFSKIFDGSLDDEDDYEDEDEIIVDRDNILLSCESLLDFASELSFEKKYLDFHYRSRHPYLIDFSNYAFYNQRLKPLPNSFKYNPIRYIQVNGIYSNNTNDIEADTVIAIIENNINRLPNGEYPTVGIATFNINQRNLILSKINDRRKFNKYSNFNDKILELEENGLFVKNLENIQGDERDVIILTTTYGLNKEGKFAQRFGSINHKKGYKLLNVIITRAKYKIYVCSSIPEEIFLNYKEYLVTEGANNRRAVFYAYLAYCKSVSTNNSEQRFSILKTLSENSALTSKLNILSQDLKSPFEEEVYCVLTAHFDEAKITTQHQFAGFKIDLVYDPLNQNIPKIAIECDGTKYHSSEESYLYDHHRQKILEGYGFIFHRIWSTNWWRNPKRETENLVGFIQNIENNIHTVFKNQSNTSSAFTDNVKVLPVVQKDIKDTFESQSGQKILEKKLNKNVVKLNSKVKIKYLNNNKNLDIHVVNEIIKTSKKINGFQKINLKSPLALSILGKAVGETIRVGNLDNYIEILKINYPPYVI